eukprot:Nitzschia sp. Nitz4//scaffold232_size35869//33896//35704//NITZ4_007816-RA/size35869-snap-gene-0.49-mRNA-1//1//CDS//3329543357//7735//frame0
MSNSATPGSATVPFGGNNPNPYYASNRSNPPVAPRPTASGAHNASSAGGHSNWQQVPPHTSMMPPNMYPMYMYDEYGGVPPPPPGPPHHNLSGGGPPTISPSDPYYGAMQPQHSIHHQHLHHMPPALQSLHHQQQPPPPAPFSATAHPTSTVTHSMDPLVQQDIQRGLQIDFYSEKDPGLLASWASFFRDQFIEARNQLAKANYDRNAETYRRVTHLVERVESKIIPSQSSFKRLYRQHPLTSMDDPKLVDSIYRTVIDYCSRNPPFDGGAFGSPTWRDYMWFKAGLRKRFLDARETFLVWHQTQILQQFEHFSHQEQIKQTTTASGEQGHGSTSDDASKQSTNETKPSAAELLLEASTTGMKKKRSYICAKRFYAHLFHRVISPMDHTTSANVTATTGGASSAAAATKGPSGEGGTSHHAALVGKKVREIYSLEEEAFILAVLQKHLQQQERDETQSLDEMTDSEGKLLRSPEPPLGSLLDDIRFKATGISTMLASQAAKKDEDAGILIFGEESDFRGDEGTDSSKMVISV